MFAYLVVELLHGVDRQLLRSGHEPVVHLLLDSFVGELLVDQLHEAAQPGGTLSEKLFLS